MDFKINEDKIWLENEEGNIIACIDFPSEENDTVKIIHTEVDGSLQGQGIASIMTKALADHLKEEGKKVIPICSYAVKWFSKHEEYLDLLVDKEDVIQ